jgi:hypothetical protein
MRILRPFAVAGFLVVTLAGAPAHAVCGDTAVDPGEHCDHGAANGADGCCTAACLLLDQDFDGLCDASDGCDNFGPLATRIKEPFLQADRIEAPTGDDVVKLRGRITFHDSIAIDPGTQGMRVTVSDQASHGFAEGRRVFDVVLPAGPRWSRRGDYWTYKDRTGSAGGITRVGVRLRPPLLSGSHWVDVLFVVEGRKGAYAITPDMVTSVFDEHGVPVGRALIVQMGFVSPETPNNPICASRYFTTTLPTSCRFGTGGSRVTCEGPPSVGPCRVSDPDDLLICDLVNVAAAQARWRARRGTYFTGTCDDLPGVVGSPGVVCGVVGDAGAFTANAAHPSATRSCTWSSAGQPNLVCF